MNQSYPTLKPVQARSKRTERLFLKAFDELLRIYGFSGTTIESVAQLSGQTRSSFLKRFGSKQGALEALFAQYCEAATDVMRDVVLELDNAPELHPTLVSTSQRYEALLQTHKASNRAMHEHFLKDLEVHELTKGIFLECVDMMKCIQQRCLDEGTYTDKGAWAAAQTLVTINYNYVLEAMPAFPVAYSERHYLIADLLGTALKR
jgi:AcrR family transcriptional regulator